MELNITRDKPVGFSEFFVTRLSECVARSIVEKSIKVIHGRASAEQPEESK